MPGSTAVYVDMLFLINLLMDFVVLWAAARLAQIRVSLWRLLAGALIGAIYSILVLLPDLQYMSGIEMKFIISIIMAIVAYLPPQQSFSFGRSSLLPRKSQIIPPRYQIPINATKRKNENSFRMLSFFSIKRQLLLGEFTLSVIPYSRYPCANA
jgi:hypothetical protein